MNEAEARRSALRVFEFEKARRDPFFYAEKYLRIRDKEGSIVRFVPNAIQRRYRAMKRKAYEQGRKRRYLVLKYRRGGITTLEQALSFHLCATRTGRDAVTLAHDKDSTEKIFRIATLFYEKLPEDLRPRRLATNKRELDFVDLRSLFYIGTAGAKGFGRGGTFQRVHGSEVSQWPGKPDEIEILVAGLVEACSHGEVVFETTANGMGNWYHHAWRDAVKGANEWVPIFLAWYMDPTNRIPLEEGERLELTEEEKVVAGKYGLDHQQIKWRREKQKERGKLFPQEYPEDPVTAFIVTGILFFDKDILVALMPLCRDQAPATEAPTEIRDGLKVWHKPEQGGTYFIGGDVSEGIPGGDLSCAAVLDHKGRQCAALHGYWRPEVFGEKCVALARWYNDALLAIEANNHGHSALNTVKNKCRYERTYVHRDYDQSGEVKAKLGWQTNLKTRPIMLDDLAAAVHGRFMEVNHAEFIGECFTFMDNGRGKYEAREGEHDDTIFAWAIAWQVRGKGQAAAPWIITPGRTAPEPEGTQDVEDMEILGI